MPAFRGLLAASLLAWLVACSNSASTSPTSPPEPAQPASTYIVSGTVIETVSGVSRPVADLRVDVYVNGTCGSRFRSPADCRVERTDVVRTDQNGRYALEVPKTRVFVFAQYPGSQPCLASAAVDKDTAIDVQVVPLGPSLPPGADPPMITGFVYETTPQRRNPLRAVDVVLAVGFGDGWTVARTRTDDAGRFALCRLNYAPLQWELVNPNVIMYVGLSGYQTFERFVTPGTNDLNLEIELKR